MNSIENSELDSKPKANTCSKSDIATQIPIKWLAGFSDAARGTTPQTIRTIKSELGTLFQAEDRKQVEKERYIDTTSIKCYSREQSIS
jgi:hypothetical protein